MKTLQDRLDQRMKPEGCKEIKGDNCVAYLFENRRGEPCAIGYIGTAGKPDFHYRFKSEESRLDHLNEWRSRISGWEARKLEQKQKRAAFQHTLKVGDIMYSSWGYDQTNIDWYQVISTTEKTVTVRQISGNRIDTEWLQGTTTPVKDAFVSDPITRKVTEGNNIRIESFAYAWAWDGAPKHWTAYA